VESGMLITRIPNVLRRPVESALANIASLTKKQIKRLKHARAGTKNSLLFLNIISESKQLVMQAVNLYKAHRDFINYKAIAVGVKK
jgi:hypothetical protein